MGFVLDFVLLNADYVNFPNDKKETRRGKSNVAPPYLAVPLSYVRWSLLSVASYPRTGAKI